MGPAEIATALVFAGLVVGLAWVLWPTPTVREGDPPPPEPDRGRFVEAPPADPLVAALAVAEDQAEPLGPGLPMLPEPARVHGADPVPRYLALRSGERALLLGALSTAVLALDPEPDERVYRGRGGARALCAVRLGAGLWLDLHGALRLLPALGPEIERSGLSGELEVVDDVPEWVVRHGIKADGLHIPAMWLVEPGHPRVAPPAEPPRRTWHLVFEVGTLEVEVDVGAASEGIARGMLRYAGVARFRFADGEEVVTAGATPTSLVPDPALLDPSRAAWAFRPSELAALVGAADRALQAGHDPLALLEQELPAVAVPDPGDDPMHRDLVAGALNLHGVLLRRVGLPARALSRFDRGLEVVATDPQRQELHYNRGYARLQTAMPEPPADGPGRLRVARFDGDVDPALLEACRADFEEAIRLAPDDADAWSQTALVAQLQQRPGDAAAAWEHAAELVDDPELVRAFRDNAALSRSA